MRRMTKSEKEHLSFYKVIEWEKAHNRIATYANNSGYDLCSKNQSEERHIAVRTTFHSIFTCHEMESLEYQAIQKDEEFYLYLVTGIDSKSPKIWVYDRNRLADRFSKVIYKFSFPKDDFKT